MNLNLRLLYGFAALMFVLSVWSLFAWLVLIWIAAAMSGRQDTLVLTGWWSLLASGVFAVVGLIAGYNCKVIAQQIERKNDA